ncbi:AAA family ATPase [Sphingomonas daechungensis]|uniref:AAA family ATPase n=1 Tax=Sphingomonas daechungensis TaxID=1176646 RepID=UPI00378468E0
MFDIHYNEFRLKGLGRINVILGKNGCGKSYALKQLENGLRSALGFRSVRYVSPERGGVLRYEPNIDQSITQNSSWLNDNRRNNQSAEFRQQSFVLFRRLELAVLREIERDHIAEGYVPRTFDKTVDKLNILLDRIMVVRDQTLTFRLVDRATGNDVAATEISSGEAELVSLGIEFLAFASEADKDAANVLFVDEPDVHLHPDLQYRFARFVVELMADQPMTLILATHSTPILSGLAEDSETTVAFMRRGETRLDFKMVSSVDRSILPIFGAHPLSNVFNQSPILLIEGEDDERVWQQAVRKSDGKLRFYPCVVDGVDRFSEFEAEVGRVIEAVYDDAVAYSLRDRDLGDVVIGDVGPIIRMKLLCRAAENLMLTDEALGIAGIDWESFCKKVSEWANANEGHQYHGDVLSFVESGFDRLGHNLKSIRNILIGLTTNKPWEVVVGQAIAQVALNGGTHSEGSLRHFLGPKACLYLLKLTDTEGGDHVESGTP